MSPKVQKILEEALELPDEARADLAAALLESLEPAGEDVETAWFEEIARRAITITALNASPNVQ